MIKEVIGDILSPAEETDKQVIVCHQVNCMGVMGSGLAKQVREKFPEVYHAYRQKCRLHNTASNLGSAQLCSVIDDSMNYIIVNIFGQLSYGTNERQTDYEAVKKALSQVAKAVPFSIVRIPYKMGCGLGGGDWDIILDIISATLDVEGIEVEIWKLPNA